MRHQIRKGDKRLCGDATHWFWYFQSHLLTCPVWVSGEALTQGVMLAVPGAAAVGQGEIPGLHHRARSQHRLWPVGRLDPREERVAFHPGATEERHHCRGLCAALTVSLKDYREDAFKRIKLPRIAEPVVTLDVEKLLLTYSNSVCNDVGTFCHCYWLVGQQKLLLRFLLLLFFFFHFGAL